ncbi:DNA circularization protein [Undibacterium sp. Ren11W]|uniref:DNA circularization protein n=1 Tax=Undibacterium sp. Ren11W TaxID=3413045 RepID=UPI003BF281CF
MTWANNLLPASFRTIEFDMLSVDDEATRALARHAYPYTDGADVEDMGREARKVSVKAIFFGDDYEQRLQEFLIALDMRGAGVLVHPVYGVMQKMQVSSYRTSHVADTPDSCTISIEFEESVTAEPFFDRNLASQKADAVDAAANNVEAANAAVLAAECNKIETAANGGSMEALSRIGAMRQQAVSFLLTVNNEVHGVVTSISDPIRNVLGFVADVTSACQSMVDIVPTELEYLQNFATSSFNKVDRLLSTSSLVPVVASANNPPASYQAWLATTTANAISLTPSVIPGAGAGAGSGSGSAGLFIPASSTYLVSAAQSTLDTQVLTTYFKVQSAVVKSHVLATVMASESAEPHLTPGQVEQLVSTIRTSVNNAITSVRARYNVEQARAITEPLKTLALTAQESGRSILNARPPLTVRLVDSPAPLRLLAHLWYGNHARSLELQRLNNLRRPNSISTGDKLNAYAK